LINWTAVIEAATRKGVREGTKIIADEAKRGIAETAHSIHERRLSAAAEAERTLKETSRKKQVVARMRPYVVKKLALDRGLLTEGSRYSTIEEYREAVASTLSLNNLLDFAHARGLYVGDITREINREESDEVERHLREEHDEPGSFAQVFTSIQEFEPTRNYRREYMFQAELYQWLKSRFSDTGFEVQSGSSRPDIVVGRIAIEVKGPTTVNELKAIADKCMRYTQHFGRGIIIVLFDVNVHSDWYEEWANAIKKTHCHLAHVEIIRK